MVKKKGKSKRTSLKDKYKIQRRVVESHRKSRKQAKRDAKNGVVRHTKKKRDPGIPNSWPFKRELLTELARAKERNAEKVRAAKEAKREERIRAGELGAGLDVGGEAKSLEELVANSARAREDFEGGGGGAGRSTTQPSNVDDDGTRTLKKSHGQSSRRAYLRELKKVVDASDVVLQILDARDPSGTRASRAVEDAILSHSDKRMVLVLNKIDLVPKDAVRGWLTHLRRSHPTVALRAATGSNRGDTDATLGRARGDGAVLNGTSAVGVEGLLHLLKNYCRGPSGDGGGGGGGSSGRGKGSIVVGVVGYPNVGKSSIINSLKRARAVGVSPRPGFTTAMQEVVLDKNVRLLDSPGVVFDDDDDGAGGAGAAAPSVLLRNCVDADSMDDPVSAVGALLARCSRRSLMETYEIPAFPAGDEGIFLGLIARKRGKVLKGGIPDKVSAARTVLRDWNSGRVPFYTPPPIADSTSAGMGDGDGASSARIVSSFGKEFDVSQMEGFDEEMMDALEEKDEVDFVKMTAQARGRESGRANGVAKVLAGDDNMDEDEDAASADDSDEVEEMDEDVDNEGKSAKRKFKSKRVLRLDEIANAEDYDFADL